MSSVSSKESRTAWLNANNTDVPNCPGSDVTYPTSHGTDASGVVSEKIDDNHSIRSTWSRRFKKIFIYLDLALVKDRSFLGK